MNIPKNVLAVINKHGKVVTLCSKTKAACFKDKQLFNYIENNMYLNNYLAKD